LGFETKVKDENISVIVPHYRHHDISIPEDLVEEIARIFGYHNLPDCLPPLTTLNVSQDKTFDWEYKIKTALKYWGWTETMSYSMTSKELLNKAQLNPESCLKISNPLTDDLVYLRTSLIPSLLEVIAENTAEEKINIFEMANIYLPQKNTELPDESIELTLASDSLNYLEIKGILESLLKELGIINFEIKKVDGHILLNQMVGIFINNVNIGIIGKVKKEILNNFGIKKEVWVADLEVKRLLEFASNAKKYIPSPKYPAIVEDLTFIIPPQTNIGPVIEEIKKVSDLIREVKTIGSYQNTKTLRIFYQSDKQNLSENEVKPIREKIIDLLEKKFGGKLKI